MKAGGWRFRCKLKKAISHVEQGIKGSREFIEYIDEHWSEFFDTESEWAICKSKIIEQGKAVIAGLSQLDQLQAKYRKKG